MKDEQKFMKGVWNKVEERERDIEILNALERKNESNMLTIAKEFISVTGVKGLLNGIADVVAVSMVITICFFIGIYMYLGFGVQNVYSMVFIFSPILYASIFLLSYIKEVQTNTIYIQMSCRYTFFHVLVFRMLLNSGLSVLFNLVYIVTLNSMFHINVIKALALSFSSLMFFSVLLLKSLRYRNKLFGFSFVAAVWFGLNLLSFYGIRELYIHFIAQIPISILVFTTVIFMALYGKELRNMMKASYRRRYLYA